ncbi:MAG: 4-oxalocrotonate tautomerase [Parasphingorhabdus sp.]|jgi:4-oxalocrotonate tautomerase
MPMIRVEMLAGRNEDQKRELAKELTDAFVRTCGGTPDGLHIVITDIEKHNWAVGGQLLSDKLPDK